MHHCIQKLRTALKDENTVYAQLYRFLGLLPMLYFAFAGVAETGTTVFKRDTTHEERV
jgi:hypothetical protein